MVGLAPESAFAVALGGLLFTGIMNPITNGPIHAVFQSAIAPEMQGRAFSVIGSACSAMAPLGMLIAGPVADAIGVQGWFILAGLSCLSMSIVGRLSPAVMRLEEGRRTQDAGAGSPIPVVQAGVGAD